MFAISQDGKRLVGHLAKRQAITNARNTVYASKRLIGRRFDSREVQRAIELCPYEIVRGPNDDPRIVIAGKTFTSSEIAAIILREMKHVAEEYLGEPVTDAVITVPAHFNDTQRQCTKDAGKIAGLDVLRIINEPTAAALAYGLGKTAEQKIAVYDLGGGTFDISILELGEGVVEVLATVGRHLPRRRGLRPPHRRSRARAVPGARGHRPAPGLDGAAAAEGRRREGQVRPLDAATRPRSTCRSSRTTRTGRATSTSTLDRETLEGLVGDVVAQTMKSVEQCVTDAGLAPKDIDHVVLVGGQTRMPLVQRRWRSSSASAPHRGVNPDEVVAVGAAIQGSVLVSDDRDLLLLDVTPLSLGIATFDGHFATLIERNTTVPVQQVAHLHHHARQPVRGEDPRAAGRERARPTRTTCSASSCSPTCRRRRRASPRSRSSSTSTPTAS